MPIFITLLFCSFFSASACLSPNCKKETVPISKPPPGKTDTPNEGKTIGIHCSKYLFKVLRTFEVLLPLCSPRYQGGAWQNWQLWGIHAPCQTWKRPCQNLTQGESHRKTLSEVTVPLQGTGVNCRRSEIYMMGRVLVQDRDTLKGLCLKLWIKEKELERWYHFIHFFIFIFCYFSRSHCYRSDSCSDCGPSSRVSSSCVQIHEIKTQLWVHKGFSRRNCNRITWR